jgi:DNA primase
MSVIDDIKNRLDIVDIVSETVKLRKAGKNYTGFCPFHTNVHTPAFVVFQDSGTWRCFGQCNEGGDIFKFVMKREGWDFAQTLKFLADRAGVKLEPLTPERAQESEASEKLSSILEDAVTFFRNQLLHTPAGQQARQYLDKRGLTDSTIELFGLGYAPGGWDALLNYFSGKGIADHLLMETGLITERESQGYYDRFRNRITFPIRNASGKMTGFGARILDPNDVPKFINSPQTSLFDKGKLLYGLDAARKTIRAQDQVVVVEGYLDVILLHQAGFSNTVSPMGTALTEDQVRLIKKYTRRIVLALDADAAGQKATLRGLEIARSAMDHETEIGFDIHGLLRNEARLQADIRVTTIPEGMDPDEVVLRNPDEWKNILASAKPLVIHVMETLSSGQDLADPKVKQGIAAQILPLIEDVPSLVERDAYRQRLARLLRVDEDALGGERFSQKNKSFRYRAGRSQNPPDAARLAESQLAAERLDPLLPIEDHLLSVLTQQPDLLHRLDRMLQQCNLNRLSESDFTHSDRQQVFQIIESSLTQDEIDPAEYVVENSQGPVAELVKILKVKTLPDGVKQDALIEDIFRSAIRIRLFHTNQSLNELRYLQEDNTDSNQENISYQEQVLMFIQLKQKLNIAIGTLSKIKS